MRTAALLTALALATTPPVRTTAQWQIQDAHTTADLRGIDYVGNGVAWASGSNGTVLRTEDMGFVWQLCATPPGAEKLDFRGIQAFDNNTAIVMSSGKGDLSRLYKTTDGCQTWKLVFTNPDKDGFWDAIAFTKRNLDPSGFPAGPPGDAGELVGDPVRGHFVVKSYMSFDWIQECDDPFAPSASPGEALFAASNTSVLSLGRRNFMIGTGGLSGARVIFFRSELEKGSNDLLHSVQYQRQVPIGSHSPSSGIFSLAIGDWQHIVAVGGDYMKPERAAETAAYSSDHADHWAAATTPPHGYRSAVAYDKAHNTWITVGPNGTDTSTDDGRNWRALKPSAQDAPDADQHWNALSLPFVVGPHGRIGILRKDALSTNPDKHPSGAADGKGTASAVP